MPRVNFVRVPSAGAFGIGRLWSAPPTAKRRWGFFFLVTMRIPLRTEIYAHGFLAGVAVGAAIVFVAFVVWA